MTSNEPHEPARWAAPGADDPAPDVAGDPVRPIEPPGPPAPAGPGRATRWPLIAVASLAAVVLVALVAGLAVRAWWPSRPTAPAPDTTPAAMPPSPSPPAEPTPTPTPEPGPPVTLTVAFWGDLGITDVQDEYREVAPNVTIEPVAADYDVLHHDLRRQLLAGTGAPDVVAVDEGYVTQFRDLADRFVDLRSQVGGAARQADFLPWQWQQSLGRHGEQIGLPLYTGGGALCYRRDLFAAAGLPTDRDAVGALWPDWKSFVAVARRYSTAVHKPFVDNASSLFQPMLRQQPVGYFAPDGRLEVSGGVRTTWNTLLPLTEPGVSARLAQFSSGWDTAMDQGGFAVMHCPIWMLDHVEEAAFHAARQWDVAPLPGVAGNWGGAFFTIPRQGRHTAEAWKFVNWYTQRERQTHLFTIRDLLPSEPAALASDEVGWNRRIFFDQAPVGQLYRRSVTALRPQYLGSRTGDVRVEVEGAFWRVELGELTASAGWRTAVRGAGAASRP